MTIKIKNTKNNTITDEADQQELIEAIKKALPTCSRMKVIDEHPLQIGETFLVVCAEDKNIVRNHVTEQQVEVILKATKYGFEVRQTTLRTNEYNINTKGQDDMFRCYDKRLQ